MNDHYFSAEPTSLSNVKPCTFTYRGQSLTFDTDSGVFSKGELDKGTELLLNTLPPFEGSVLDVGCGWGAIGIAIAKANPKASVTMSDVNTRALELSRENGKKNKVTVHVVESDAYENLGNCLFQAIVTNPPIRAGKQVIYGIFEKAREHLLPCGSLYLVIRKQQGAPSAITYLKTLYSQVEILEKSSGFFVICCKNQ